MDQKQWIQTEELLQQALDLSCSQRAVFLKEHCAGDDTLLANVKALLDRETQANSFMESPAVAHLLSRVNDAPSRISHYRIYALAFSPDGRRLITGEHDRSVRQYTRHRRLWGFSLE